MRLDPSQPGPSEVFGTDGTPRPLYEPVLDEMERMGPAEWDRRTRHAHEMLLRMQRGIELTGEDKTHPTDHVPRLIPAGEWERLERGVIQRMLALNEFLRRLEVGKQEIVPAEVLEISLP